MSKLSTFVKCRILAAAIAIALLASIAFLAPAHATESISNTSVQMTFLSTLNKVLDLPGASGASPIAYTLQQVFSSGSGANQADIVWQDERTLSASSSESLQLTTSGGLLDAFGGVLNLTAVKVLVIKALPANTNNVIVGGLASNCFIGPFGSCATAASTTIRPGGFAVFVAPDATGYAVTASTGDLLKVANSGSGTSVTYDIIILGVE